REFDEGGAEACDGIDESAGAAGVLLGRGVPRATDQDPPSAIAEEGDHEWRERSDHPPTAPQPAHRLIPTRWSPRSSESPCGCCLRVSWRAAGSRETTLVPS